MRFSLWVWPPVLLVMLTMSAFPEKTPNRVRFRRIPRHEKLGTPPDKDFSSCANRPNGFRGNCNSLVALHVARGGRLTTCSPS